MRSFHSRFNRTASSGISRTDRKSTRLNSSHMSISYAVFCLKKKKNNDANNQIAGGSGHLGRQSHHQIMNKNFHGPGANSQKYCTASGAEHHMRDQVSESSLV